MADNSVEIGTSDQQALIASRRKKNLGYLAATVVLLAILGGVCALVVVYTKGEAVPSTTTTTPAPTNATEDTTDPDDTTTPVDPDDTTTTADPDVTTTTINPEDLDPLNLEEFIEGGYSPSAFNGTWSAGGEIFYRDSNGDLILYDVDTDDTTSLIYNSTSEILQQSPRVMQLSADGNEVIMAYNDSTIYRHSFIARYAAVNVETGQTNHITPPNVNRDTAYRIQNFVWGPTGTALAFVYENNVYYQSSVSSDPRQITNTGQLNVIYHGIPDWVYEEEIFGSNNALWFSKDGSKLAYASFDDSDVKIMNVPYYGEPGSVNDQYTQHNKIRYPKAGTTNPTVSVTLIDVNTNFENVYTAPSLFPILRTVKFVTDSSIALVWTNRVQNQMSIQLCNYVTAGQPSCRVILTHSESTRNGWIDKLPLLFNDAGNAFITILPYEVDGVLYKQLVQATEPSTGNAEWSLQNRANTAHTVLEILSWKSDDVIWYTATGVEDAAEQHIYTVNSAGEVSCFTCIIRREDGRQCLFNDGILSNAGDRIVINCAGPDVPQLLIFDTDANLVRVWDDNEKLATLTRSLVQPTKLRHTLPASAALPGGADVLVHAPFDYATRTDVPLLVYVYAGPDTALVTHRWSLDWGSYLVSQYRIAIAHIDARGSGRKGAANMFTLNRKLGTAEVEDQITVTKYLQDNLSFIDSKRTCIWGWSYGGYAASKALAEGGDVFKCAVAVAPVVDWRFYDTIYTERYMDVPSENQEGYKASSLLTDEVVESLRNKSYFLIHGTGDDNVHYQHAMLLSRLLQESNVYFTQMSYTDEAHGLRGVQPHLYYELEHFLKENLF